LSIPDDAARTGCAAAVLGQPIGHSLSPTLHRAAYRALGLTQWRYDAIECTADGLAGVLRGAGPEVVGYSCTMPLKREVLRVAHTVTDEARAIGAGNTLLRHEGGWRADNTDWIGIRAALAERAIATTGTVAILGAGGTAQAALAALTEAAEVTVLVRDVSRTDELRAAAERLGMRITVALLTERRVPAAVDLIVSTLPAQAADPLAALPWRKDQALLDVVYRPWPTALARSMSGAGATVVSGASMLLHQAARQVELMTGRAAPVEAMRAALLAAVPDCAA
jgi:shikimate dehydrogenase